MRRTRLVLAVTFGAATVVLIPNPAGAHWEMWHGSFSDRDVTVRFTDLAIEMNAAFNAGFVDNQSAAEQLFNRASLKEFHGKKIGKEVDQALERFEASIKGLDRATAKNRELLEMLESNTLIPEFEAALQKHIAALGVRQLPLVTLDPVQPNTSPTF